MNAQIASYLDIINNMIFGWSDAWFYIGLEENNEEYQVKEMIGFFFRDMKFAIRVIFIGFISLNFVALVAYASCAGDHCTKSEVLPNKTSAKPEKAGNSAAPPAVAHHNKTRERTEASNENDNPVMPEKSHSNEGRAVPDFHTQDYHSYDPAPGFKRPPPKLISNR
eukprot:Gb_30280 [translate_table: standard]